MCITATSVYGIRKYHAEPYHPDAARGLVVFGTTGFIGDREGLAIVATGQRSGFIVASDQVANESLVKLYPREGTPRNPPAHFDERGCRGPKAAANFLRR